MAVLRQGADDDASARSAHGRRRAVAFACAAGIGSAPCRLASGGVASLGGALGGDFTAIGFDPVELGVDDDSIRLLIA